ncbi:nicotinamide mononucleotide adenylyltransferase [Pseudomonas frederiksbergensis]
MELPTNFGASMKKKHLIAGAGSILTLIISIFVLPGMLERSKNAETIQNQAFTEHYISTTKKAEECLDTDQQLLQESSLLAGTAIVARTELNRISQKDFRGGAHYEVIIRSAFENFTSSQTSYEKVSKADQNCWRELAQQMEQTALALNVHSEFKTPDKALVNEEKELNTTQDALVENLRKSTDIQAMYESLVSLSSTSDEEQMRKIFQTVNPAIDSLVDFYGKMIGLTQQRTVLKQKYYLSKKEIFLKKINENKNYGFFKSLWPF